MTDAPGDGLAIVLLRVMHVWWVNQWPVAWNAFHALYAFFEESFYY